jgi:hypothetical protein
MQVHMHAAGFGSDLASMAWWLLKGDKDGRSIHPRREQVDYWDFTIAACMSWKIERDLYVCVQGTACFWKAYIHVYVIPFCTCSVRFVLAEQDCTFRRHSRTWLGKLCSVVLGKSCRPINMYKGDGRLTTHNRHINLLHYSASTIFSLVFASCSSLPYTSLTTASTRS